MVMQAGAEKWDDEGASVDARPAPRDGSSSSSASTSSRARASENVGPGLLPSAVVADVGAFLFGYHTAVCNAPLSAIASELGFADDDGVKGVVVSALVLGGAVGGLTVGALSDKIGRKATLAWVSAPLVVGTLVSGAVTNAATVDGSILYPNVDIDTEVGAASAFVLPYAGVAATTPRGFTIGASAAVSGEFVWWAAFGKEE